MRMAYIITEVAIFLTDITLCHDRTSFRIFTIRHNNDIIADISR